MIMQFVHLNDIIKFLFNFYIFALDALKNVQLNNTSTTNTSIISHNINIIANSIDNLKLYITYLILLQVISLSVLIILLLFIIKNLKTYNDVIKDISKTYNNINKFIFNNITAKTQQSKKELEILRDDLSKLNEKLDKILHNLNELTKRTELLNSVEPDRDLRSTELTKDFETPSRRKKWGSRPGPIPP